MQIKIILIFAQFSVNIINASNILAVFPMDYKSHFFIGRSVVQTLAEEGHKITIISPHKFEHKNVEKVILDNREEVHVDAFKLAEITLYTNFVVMSQIIEKRVEFLLSHPNVQKILANGTFDAVIVEIFGNDALFGLGNHFNCPVIGITTFGVSHWTNIIASTPNPTSYNPNIFSPYTEHMTYLQRLDNTFIWWMEEILWNILNYPMQNRIYEKYLKKHSHSLMEVIKNVSIILNNQHFSSASIKPTMPNIIDIGGITVDPHVKPLPKDIKEFLDSATDGAIIFSMGSIIRSVQWPEHKREAFVKSFANIKEKVLWKYENDTLPNKPDNVMISKWIPQRDVLAHPNVKLFITHGGLLGTTEANYEGVPMLAVPIFGDQKMNMKMARDKGFTFILDFDNLSEKTVTEALQKALTDEQIRIKAKENSRIVRDRPMTPQELVVYWVEYVIRHKGAHHLKAVARDLSYIQMHNIDVYLTFIALIMLIIYAQYALVKYLLRLFMPKQIKQKTQ